MKFIHTLCLTLALAAGCIHAAAQNDKGYFLHTVTKGQSLYSISNMYNVTMEDLIRLNPGCEKQVRAGETLKIPQADNGSNQDKPIFHTIQAGETLYQLTLKYNVTAQAICNVNPGLSASNFRIGQVIAIPAQEAVRKPQESLAQAEDAAPADKKEWRDMHKVQRKETIFSISREYGITQEELIAANPELKNGKLKRGTFLFIPYPKSEQKKEETAKAPAHTPSNEELFSQSIQPPKSIQTVKTAVLLPFTDSSNRDEQLRMVEYYEGFLMAVDSIKRLGNNVELYTYDSGSDTRSLGTLLGKPELKDMDVIFGPLNQQQIKPLADFARKNGSRLVIPFTSKDNTVFRNPSVYQINTPQSYLYSEVYDHFLRHFPNANVIFVEAGNGAKDKADFIKGLKDELRNHSIPTATFKEDATKDELKPALRADRTNIFIPTSGNNLVLIKALPQLLLLVRENPEFDIHLFGYPEWQTYTHDHLETFFELDTYFYSSFYTNDLLPAAKSFTVNYRKWFGKDMEERYPKYGMLGFDTGFFFLKGLSLYGTGLEDNLDKMRLTPIQTGFKMQRVNNWGGFINKKVFFVRFTKNFELVKLDFD